MSHSGGGWEVGRRSLFFHLRGSYQGNHEKGKHASAFGIVSVPLLANSTQASLRAREAFHCGSVCSAQCRASINWQDRVLGGRLNRRLPWTFVDNNPPSEISFSEINLRFCKFKPCLLRACALWSYLLQLLRFPTAAFFHGLVISIVCIFCESRRVRSCDWGST